VDTPGYAELAEGASVFRPPVGVYSCPWAYFKCKRLAPVASASVSPCVLTFIPIADRFVGSFMGQRSVG
jgi:hypothetical protein